MSTLIDQRRPADTAKSARRSRGYRFYLKRGLLALHAGLVAIGASYEAIMADGDATRYPAPGQLVDVGGYRKGCRPHRLGWCILCHQEQLMNGRSLAMFICNL